MQNKKIIHYQIITGGTICRSDLPFDRNRLKKTKKESKVSCIKCLQKIKEEKIKNEKL